MRYWMWISTWIAVGIGGALGAASVIMLSAQSGAHGPSATARSGEQPVLATKQKTGEPSRSPILMSHRHNRLVADDPPPTAALPIR